MAVSATNIYAANLGSTRLYPVQGIGIPTVASSGTVVNLNWEYRSVGATRIVIHTIDGVLPAIASVALTGGKATAGATVPSLSGTGTQSLAGATGTSSIGQLSLSSSGSAAVNWEYRSVGSTKLVVNTADLTLPSPVAVGLNGVQVSSGSGVLTPAVLNQGQAQLSGGSSAAASAQVFANGGATVWLPSIQSQTGFGSLAYQQYAWLASTQLQAYAGAINATLVTPGVRFIVQNENRSFPIPSDISSFSVSVESRTFSVTQ